MLTDPFILNWYMKQSDDIKAEFDERAAIREFDGRQDRLTAERGAQRDVKKIILSGGLTPTKH